MFTRAWLFIGYAAALACASPASAEFVTLTAGPVIGTLGVGGEVGLIIPGGFGLRAQGTVLPVSMSFSTTAAPFQAKVNYLSGALLADYYFFPGLFRLTVGARFGDASVGLSSTPGAQTINGIAFSASQVGTLTGNLHYNSVQPYLGAGAETSLAGLTNLSLGIDAGAMYLGAPTASVSGNPLIPPSYLASQQSQIQSQASRYRFYPVLDVAVKYKF